MIWNDCLTAVVNLPALQFIKAFVYVIIQVCKFKQRYPLKTSECNKQESIESCLQSSDTHHVELSLLIIHFRRVPASAK